MSSKSNAVDEQLIPENALYDILNTAKLTIYFEKCQAVCLFVLRKRFTTKET